MDDIPPFAGGGTFEELAAGGALEEVAAGSGVVAVGTIVSSWPGCTHVAFAPLIGNFLLQLGSRSKRSVILRTLSVKGTFLDGTQLKEFPPKIAKLCVSTWALPREGD